MQDVTNRGKWGESSRGIVKLSTLYAQFFCKSKIAQKIKSTNLKKK